MDYRVSWEIDISASNPEEAAREALAIQQDPDSIATVFLVTKCETGATWKVDQNTKQNSRVERLIAQPRPTKEKKP